MCVCERVWWWMSGGSSCDTVLFNSSVAETTFKERADSYASPLIDSLIKKKKEESEKDTFLPVINKQPSKSSELALLGVFSYLKIRLNFF